MLYSRADSWLSAAAERERDRPLKSLGLLAKLSVRGIGAALSNFRSGGKEEEKEDAEKRRRTSGGREDAGERDDHQFHGGNHCSVC